MFNINLGDLTKEKRLELLAAFEKVKEIKKTIGKCPPPHERAKANCFYCDECWIISIIQSLQHEDSRYITDKEKE